MAEGEPKIEVKKEITDQEVIDAMRSHGIGDPEVHEMVLAWRDQEGEKVHKREWNIEAELSFGRRCAQVFREGGYLEEAFDTLNGSRTLALQGGKEDVAREIDAEMNAIENEWMEEQAK